MSGVRHMPGYARDELIHVPPAAPWNQAEDCRYILNPPWMNQRGRTEVTIHQHTAMGEADSGGIFETPREIGFAHKQRKPDPPEVGGDSIICVSRFDLPEKMDRQAPERIYRKYMESEMAMLIANLLTYPIADLCKFTCYYPHPVRRIYPSSPSTTPLSLNSPSSSSPPRMSAPSSLALRPRPS